MHNGALAILSSVVAGAVSSPTWVPVSQEQNGTVLLSRDSVEHDGRLATVWVEFMKRPAADNAIAYELDHWSVDCENMTIASLATMQFDSKGKQVAGSASTVYYPARVDIAPKSVGFAVYRMICR